ncbi:MAG: hypothetical protein RLZZ293_1186, partial [Pseudomonadota bacterium]
MFKQGQNFEDFFKQIATANQSWFQNLLNQNLVNNKMDNPFLAMYQQFFNNTQSYLEYQNKFYQEQLELWGKFCDLNQDAVIAEQKKPVDRRFTDPDWEKNPFFSYLKQSYLSVSKQLIDFIAKANLDDETRFRMEFFMRQYIDAISPSNFALTNPEVVKTMLETHGKSL